MPQDLADDLEVGPRVDLPARMAVPKGMRSDHLRRNTGLRGWAVGRGDWTFSAATAEVAPP